MVVVCFEVPNARDALPRLPSDFGRSANSATSAVWRLPESAGTRNTGPLDREG
jgi:hypothetical protein